METTYRYLEQETVRLDDGTDFTRAVFVRCDLIYAGGEIRISGASFLDCRFRFDGDGTRAQDLQRAMFASLYAQGIRTLAINAEGDFASD